MAQLAYLLVCLLSSTGGISQGSTEAYEPALSGGVPIPRILGRDDRSPQLYLDLGANRPPYTVEAGFPDFRPVGALISRFGDLGSATLITAEWVLTAGHIFIERSSDSVNPADWRFEVGEDLNLGRPFQTRAVAEVLIHPAFRQNPDSLSRGVDIALVRLAAPITNLPPGGLVNGDPEPLGSIIFIAGFGATGDGLRGEIDFDYRRRAAANVLDRVRTDIGQPRPVPGFPNLLGGLLAFDFDSPDGRNNTLNGFVAGLNLGSGSSDPTPLELEGTIAGGDSGGPLFVFQRGLWRVAGVGSFGTSEDGEYGDIGGYTRLGNHLRWVQTTTGALLPEYPLTLATFLGGGWWGQNWWGFYFNGNRPWIYHFDLGWGYVSPVRENAFWSYDLQLQWIKIRLGAFPWVYQASTGDWLYFLGRDNNDGLRRFFRARDGEIISVPLS
jgi:hypothetical protein